MRKAIHGAGSDGAREWWWGGCALQVVDTKERGERERAELLQPHSSPTLTPQGALHPWGGGRGGTRRMGRSPLSSSCISFPLVSNSYLYDFCLYPCNLSFARMCLEMVPFLLILPETCYIISTRYQRSSLAPGWCLIFYIFIPHFFVEFHHVLHSGRPSQVPMQVIDLVFCRVDSVLFHLKRES